MILEYLYGPEYSVDCFSDREKGVLFVGARNRLRIKAGIAVRSGSVELPGIEELASNIWKRLPFHGAWFFQVKEDKNGVLKLMEVAPRIASGSGLYRNMGVNFPMLSIYEAFRIPIKININNMELMLNSSSGDYKNNKNNSAIIMDKGYVCRFINMNNLQYTRVYVDWDDTLILRKKVNVMLVQFLYQCVNQGKSIILITRSRSTTLTQDIAKFKLSSLFDDVIHIKTNEPKWKFMDLNSCIFIDDSFRERSEASAKNVPVFDASMIECLLDSHA